MNRSKRLHEAVAITAEASSAIQRAIDLLAKADQHKLSDELSDALSAVMHLRVTLQAKAVQASAPPPRKKGGAR